MGLDSIKPEGIKSVALLDLHELPFCRDAHVGGTDDLSGTDHLLDPVCAPSAGPRNGEERREELLGDAQHPVQESGVVIDVDAHLDRGFPLGRDDLRRKPGDGLVEFEFLVVSFLRGELVDRFPEEYGPGVGDGIDRVAHTVDQTLVVEHLALEDLGEVLGKLLLVGDVGDIGADVVHHLNAFDVGTAMLRALQ